MAANNFLAGATGGPPDYFLAQEMWQLTQEELISIMRVQPVEGAQGLAKAPTMPAEFPNPESMPLTWQLWGMDTVLMATMGQLTSFYTWGKHFYAKYFSTTLWDGKTFEQRRPPMDSSSDNLPTYMFDYWHYYLQSKPKACIRLGLMMDTKGRVYFKPDAPASEDTTQTSAA